jgi:DNA-binding NarL/FixJ family response regulator
VTTEEDQPLRLLVIDDRRAVGEALCVALLQDDRVDVCETAPSMEEAADRLAGERWDVVVVEGELGGRDGAAGTAQIRRSCPDARIVMLTVRTDLDLVPHAITAGVDAFLPKSASLSEVRHAILDDELEDDGSAAMIAAVAEEVRRRELEVGERPPVELTPRERDVLGLLSRGVLVKDIARVLGITTETCRGYIKSLLVKLDARSQLQAVVTAHRTGLLDDEAPMETSAGP